MTPSIKTSTALLSNNVDPNDSTNASAINRLKHLHGKHLAAVGLSGGVDSSLTAALLIKAGWEVQGITLWLMQGKGSCCSDGLIDAAGICEQLEIPHHIIDSRKTFQKEIIQTLIDGYQQGITPSPCSRCNRSVKFSEMINWAKKNLNIDRIATGHYARIEYANDSKNKSEISIIKRNKHKLLRGLDKNKDQSYFLYDLSQNVLSSLVFPLGELTKEFTRIEASKYKLRTATKPESQDLCLAEHHGSMKAFLDNYLPSRKGEIVLKSGQVIGEHDGIEHFTIGQRKGLGVSWNVPLHVVKLDASLNRVIVATREEAGQPSCVVGEINWISIDPPQKEIKVEVQVRYRSRPVQAELIPLNPTFKDIKNNRPYRCQLNFTEDQFSISPGQAAVFYLGEIVLGGGIIQQQEP
tara:strand:- start:3185 stop:4411 length:1227 start_codon:yes stop_codon:yes gene_type:complete